MFCVGGGDYVGKGLYGLGDLLFCVCRRGGGGWVCGEESYNPLAACNILVESHCPLLFAAYGEEIVDVLIVLECGGHNNEKYGYAGQKTKAEAPFSLKVIVDIQEELHHLLISGIVLKRRKVP